MNQILRNEKMLQKWAVLLLCLAIPALALGQKKTSTPSHTAPSHSTPQTHTAPSHTQTAGHGNTTAGHGNTTAGHGNTTASHGNTTAGHGNTTASHGNTTAGHGNTTASHGNTTAGHGNTTAGHGNTTAGHGNTTAGHGNTTAGHGNTTAGHGNTTAGHGNTTAGHGNAAASRGNFHQPAGTRNVSLRGGGRANVRANGSIRSVDRNGMHIDRGLHGGRTVVSVHNNVRVVSYGHGGYVQHAYFSRGGRSFYSRTFVVGGVVHVGVYRGYFWGGRNYYGFYPGFWYHPGFYGWGFQPWGVPVAWGIGAWGWGGPWWGYYGGWWNPYPVYAAPYFWLTDYLIAANLQAAYAARPEESADAGVADAGSTDTAAAPASTAVTLTPEVKQAIAEEVKAQLAAQQAQAQAGGATAAPASASASAAPPALDPANRTFVVDTAVTAVANGTECGLTSGDVVTRLTDTPDATDNTVNASVSATKKGDCASGATVAIKVDDLQEMYNHFQEQLTSGMGELAKKQGTNGMPKAPDTGTTASDVPTPKPDPDAAKDLKDQQAEADKTEADVKAEAAAGGGL